MSWIEDYMRRAPERGIVDRGSRTASWPAVEAGGGDGRTGGEGVKQASGQGDGEPKYYTGFSGSSYGDVEDFLRDRMKSYHAETDAERERRERRERAAGWMGSVADVLGGMHRGWAYGRGVRPMDLSNVSERVRERVEKARAAREKDADRVLNYALTLGRIKDSDRDFNLKLQQAEHAQGNYERSFDADREDKAADRDYKDRSLAEGKRQFDVSQAEKERAARAAESLEGARLAEQARHNRASEGLDGQRIAASQDGKYTEFYSGSGMVRIPNTRLNQHNISYVFSKTPTAGRPMPTTTFEGTKPVSADQMMDWIGSNIDDPNVQSALRAIGGEERKGTGYDGGGRGRGY